MTENTAPTSAPKVATSSIPWPPAAGPGDRAPAELRCRPVGCALTVDGTCRPLFECGMGR